MVNVKNRLGKNIKYLRTAYNESQLSLALAISLDSPNAIANYEKGIRNPKPDIRKKIAAHYRITEDELMHTDFSAIHFTTFQLGDKEKMMEMTLLMLPVICTENAMKDSMFQKGYAVHMRALDAIKAGQEFEDNYIDVCVDSYSNSMIPESLANLLWWFLITELIIKNQRLVDGAIALSEKRINSSDFFKHFYLKDCSDLEEEYQSAETEEQELEELEKPIVEKLKELKSYTEWADLANYYMALRYLTGCIRNELTSEMNKAVGAEMIWAFM